MGTDAGRGGLGVCFGPGWDCSVADLMAAASLAEERGFARVTTGEYRSDPFTWLALIAGATRRIRLGTTIASVHTRHPMIAAEAIAAIADVHGARIEPGFGLSHAALDAELGLAPTGLEDLTDYVRCVRAVLDGQPAEHGRHRVPATLRARRTTVRIPILVAALGITAARAGLAHADGLVLTWTPLRRVAEVRALVDEDGSGPDRHVVRVVLPTFSHPDIAVARAAAAQALHRYLQLPAYRRMLADATGDPERVADAASGGAERVAAVLGPKTLDEVAALGPPGRILDAVGRQVDAGADDVVLYPLDTGGGWREALEHVLTHVRPPGR